MVTGTVQFVDGLLDLNLGSATLVAGTSPGTATATLTTSLLSLLGTHSLTASYLGDANVLSSVSAPLLEIVGSLLGSASATSLSSTPNPSILGQSVALTATVSGGNGTPTGTVTFKDGSTTVGTGTLSGGTTTLNITTLAAGTTPHSLTAVYGGSGRLGLLLGYSASTSPPVSQLVHLSSSVALGAAPSSAPVTTPVTLTATVTPSAASGTVTFAEGATTLGTGTISGGTATLTTSTLAVGGHGITAAYGGDGTYAVSSSAPVTVTVTPALIGSNPSATALTSSPDPSTSGQVVTLTATVTPASPTPSGTVTFEDGTTPIGTAVTLSGGSATTTTSTLSVATHSITAVYSGDPHYAGSTSPAVSQTVGAAAPTDLVAVILHSHAIRANGIAQTGVAATTVIAGTHASASGTKTTITASEPNGSGTDQEKLLGSQFGTTLTFTPASVPVNGLSSAVATVVDGSGAPVAGETIDFTSSGGGPTFATPSAVTDAGGNATDAATGGSTVGDATVTASDGGSDITADNFAESGTLVQTAATAAHTNTGFVGAACTTMLGRNCTAAEIAAILAMLDSGTTRSAISLAFATLPEYRTNVISGNGTNDFYQLYLDRTGEPGGVAYWVGQMAAPVNMTFEQVRLRFAGSPEYFASQAVGNNDQLTAIRALYTDLLGRTDGGDSDTLGQAYWLSHYNATTIAGQFLFSQEGRSVLVNSLYQQILGRSAEPQGLAYWTNALLSGASDENIIASILSSDEFFNTH